MSVQAFVQERSVERFDVPIVGRFAGPREVDFHSVPEDPCRAVETLKELVFGLKGTQIPEFPEKQVM